MVYEVILGKELLDPAFRRIIANKVEKTDKTKTKVTLGKPGTTVITATANDTLKSSFEVPIKVVDKTAAGVSISATTVTLNTALENAAAQLKIYNGFDAQLKDVTCTATFCDVTWETDGTITLIENETTKKGGKVMLEVLLSDGVDEVSKTFTITLKTTAKKPSVTVKQLTKLNTFYKNSSAMMSIGSVGETISDVTIKELNFNFLPKLST